MKTARDDRLARVVMWGLCLAGCALVARGAWDLVGSVDRKAVVDSSAMAALLDIGQSLRADISRTVEPAMVRTTKLAGDPALIAALREGDVNRQTAVCNAAISQSTEIDAVAVFDRNGKIVAINTIYTSGKPIAPSRVDRVLRMRFDGRDIIQKCVRNQSNQPLLEFQTKCDITPALFDSTGLSVAYSVPVMDPVSGRKIGVVSSRMRFGRLTALISKNEIAGPHGSVEFVTDQGKYFSEAINSGAMPPPVEPAILEGIVAPLVQGKSDYCFTQHGKQYLCLFRLEDLSTIAGGGIQVMLVTDADWLGKEAKQSRSLESLTLIGAGVVLAIFAVVVRGIASLRHSDRLNRRLNEEMSRTEALLETVLDSSLVGVMAFQAVRNGAGLIADFNCLQMNIAAERLLERTEQDIKTCSLLKAFPAARADGLFDAYCQVVEDRTPMLREHRTLRSDGAIRWYDISAAKLGAGDGFVVTFADISRRKIGEEALRRSEAAARKLAVVAAQTDNAVSIGDAQARIEWVNAAFCRLTECSLEEVKGKVIGSILHGPETDPMTIELMRSQIEEGRGFNVELFNYTKSGRRIWVHLEAQAVRDAGGAIENFILIRTDLTSRKLGEDESKSARDAAEAATRSKSEFLANMSHEIRTPITAIVGFADMMLDPGQTVAERHDSLQTIRRNAKHLLGLINDVLDISKIEAGQMTVEKIEADVPSLLAEVMSLMGPRAIEKKLELALVFDAPVPRQLITDALRLKQVLVNLLSNATKFTSSGRIELRVGARAGAGGQDVIFRVVDTGIGMTEEQTRRVFRPFAQADGSTTRKYGGTGLGLTISRRLAELLGGDISVSSVPGAGSTFTASIRTDAIAGVEWVSTIEAHTAPAPEPPPVVERLSGRLLLAEDGKDNQRFISAMLRTAGADVTIADNGRIAVELAMSQTFDLIFMDMQMPEMDGYEAASILRAEGLTLPIIALTAHAMSDDRHKCIQAGCTDYLTKPIDRAALVHEAGKYLRRALAPGLVPVEPRAGADAPASLAPRVTPPRRLISTCHDDPAIAGILPDFIATLPEQVRALRQWADAREMTRLAAAIHQLKGAADATGSR